MRTNIEIDDELMQKAMAATGATTKKATVVEALRLVVQLKQQGEAIRSLWGVATWCGPDDDWFAPDPLDPGWEEEMVRRGIREPVKSGPNAPEGSEIRLAPGAEMVGSHGTR